MNSAVQSAPPAPSAGMPQPASPVTRIRRDGAKSECICADGRELRISHLVAANLQVGDAIFSSSLPEAAADAEIYIHKPSLRRADIYNAEISYAALPKPDTQ